MQQLTLIKIKITGIFPLLTHNPQSMIRDPKVKNKKLPTIEEEAESGVYRNEKGNICIPSCSFRASLLNGLKNKKIGKSSAISVFQAAVFNIDEFSVLIDPQTGKPLKKYTIDSRRAVVQRQGIIRNRPRFEKWGCYLILQIDEDVVSPEIVVENLNNAGMICGVGDFRIEKRGPFGRFSAELIK
jgi:hypothetical protein